MYTHINSGYNNIFRPPYNLSKQSRSTIYCVGTKFDDVLILIPLVPAFYNDAINIIKRSNAREIYLIAQDMGVAFISDFYNVYYEVSTKLRRDIKIFSAYMPENTVSSDFENAIIRTPDNQFTVSFARAVDQQGLINIQLLQIHPNAKSPFACDIVLSDTYNRKLFVADIDEQKAAYLTTQLSSFDELHMAYITGNYCGWTYSDLIRNFSKFANITYCNQFQTDEEYKYAISRGVKIGGVFRI